jgi:hypothetical protein
MHRVVALNPAASVLGERYQGVVVRTPELSVEQALQLLRSIEIRTVAGHRA